MEIVLVHSIFRPPSKLVAFYDGHLVAYDGVLRIPIDGERSLRWARNAYLNGYRLAEDGSVYASWTDVERVIENGGSAESARVPNATEQYVNPTSFDPGRQPETEHRIRARKSSSSKSIQK